MMVMGQGNGVLMIFWHVLRYLGARNKNSVKCWSKVMGVVKVIGGHDDKLC